MHDEGQLHLPCCVGPVPRGGQSLSVRERADGERVPPAPRVPVRAASAAACGRAHLHAQR